MPFPLSAGVLSRAPAAGVLRRPFGRAYADKVLALFGSSIISYLPLWEPSGSVAADYSGNGRSGTYIGVTLGQPGIGDGRTAPFFDGVNDFVDIGSAGGLLAALNGEEGTLAAWARVANAGVWTDGTVRYVARLLASSERLLQIRKSATNNTLELTRIAKGGPRTVTITTTTTAWMSLAITWSVSANQLKAYLNGLQVGSTLGCPAMSGVSFVNNGTEIGAEVDVPLSTWHGWLAHVLILNRAATAAEVAEYARV